LKENWGARAEEQLELEKAGKVLCRRHFRSQSVAFRKRNKAGPPGYSGYPQ
jgi:hypothetical protein